MCRLGATKKKWKVKNGLTSIWERKKERRKLFFCFSNRFRPHLFLPRFLAQSYVLRPTSTGSCWMCVSRNSDVNIFLSFFSALLNEAHHFHCRLPFNSYLVLCNIVSLPSHCIGVPYFPYHFKFFNRRSIFIENTERSWRKKKQHRIFLCLSFSVFCPLNVKFGLPIVVAGNVLMMSFIWSLRHLFAFSAWIIQDALNIVDLFLNDLAIDRRYAALLHFRAHWIISVVHGSRRTTRW